MSCEYTYEEFTARNAHKCSEDQVNQVYVKNVFTHAHAHTPHTHTCLRLHVVTVVGVRVRVVVVGCVTAAARVVNLH